MPGGGRRLLVVEDEPFIASLLAEALRANGFEVTTAANVLEAREQIKTFDPDAALIDISLGYGPSGLDLAHLLSKQRPDIALLILTKHADARAGDAEALDVPERCGFLRKDKVRDTDYLLRQLETVLADNAQQVRDDRDASNPLAGLTSRQLEVLRLIATGYTNEHIAQITGSSLSSVERWVMQIFQLLGISKREAINSRVEATRIFITASSMPERL